MFRGLNGVTLGLHTKETPTLKIMLVDKEIHSRVSGAHVASLSH